MVLVNPGATAEATIVLSNHCSVLHVFSPRASNKLKNRRKLQPSFILKANSMLKDWRKLQPSVKGQVRISRRGAKYNPQSNGEYQDQGPKKYITLSPRASNKIKSTRKNTAFRPMAGTKLNNGGKL